jgi:peroxiredoxin Q/BCP
LPFVLLSDKDKKIRKLFGVSSLLFGLLPGRVTYLVNENGIIKMIFESIKRAKHVSKVL